MEKAQQPSKELINEYLKYIERGDSAAIAIIKKIVLNINTKNKWIDVLKTQGHKDYTKDHGMWNFSKIDVEVFPRKIHPRYEKTASKKEKKFITWSTAQEDIEKQRLAGIKGTRYRIKIRLVNKNTSSCVPVKRKVEAKPKWEYEVISCQKI